MTKAYGLFGSVYKYLQMRVRILRSYINDLTDQNSVLMKTVEDLEADADGRVARLEAKLQKSSAVIKVQQCRMIRTSDVFI